MQPEQWSRVQDLFHHAVELPPERREAFLCRACAEEPELLAEVLSLLKHDPEAGGRRRRLPRPGGEPPRDPEI